MTPPAKPVNELPVEQVMGAVMKRGTEPMLVMECMDHGSLYDLLHNETVRAHTPPAVEPSRHTHDCHGHILALASKSKS